jgi:hypothetical protein
VQRVRRWSQNGKCFAYLPALEKRNSAHSKEAYYESRSGSTSQCEVGNQRSANARTLGRSGPGENSSQWNLFHRCLDHARDDSFIRAPFPAIFGHEAVGEMEAVGAGVTSRQPGDRVLVPFVQASCGRCAFCVQEKLLDALTWVNCAHPVLRGETAQGLSLGR